MSDNSLFRNSLKQGLQVQIKAEANGQWGWHAGRCDERGWPWLADKAQLFAPLWSNINFGRQKK